MNCIKMYVLLLFVCSLQLNYAQELKFADVLQSNMVIQQGKPFKIWGTAPKEAPVVIQADWLPKPVISTADVNGRFEAFISVPKAKRNDYTAHEIKLSSGEQSRSISNLLIGDLWFASGQSNMQFRMKELDNSLHEISQADVPAIRMLTAEFNYSGDPIQRIKGQWQVCAPQTVQEFSAVGYYFAVKLHEELQIPIGIIYSGVGGSVVQAYIPKEVLQADTLLNKSYLASFQESIRAQEPIEGVFTWDRLASPYLLYNAMINPFTNLSIKGFLWYQGESNVKERETYSRATEAMIKAWRHNFSQGDLPFYYVQIAPYSYGQKDPDTDAVGFFREVQANLQQLKKVKMVTTLDVGNPTDIHPKEKKPIGVRLALLALNQTYKEKISYQGPQFDQLKISGRQAAVSFKPQSVSGGLVTSDGQPPKYFQIAGSDGVFYTAQVQIVGNKVILESSNVTKPIAVRYAFVNAPMTNLQNGEGLPAEQFRTDNWKENWIQPNLSFVPVVVE